MNNHNFKVTPDIYASKSNRFVNYIIDYVMKIIVGIGVVLLIGVVAQFTESYALYNYLVESESRVSDYVLGIIMVLIYFNIIESLTGKSVGKFVTKTTIVLEDGSTPKFSDIFLRTLCRLIPFEIFSFLKEDGRGWHDSMSNTYVVDEKLFIAKKNALNSLDEIGRTIGE